MSSVAPCVAFTEGLKMSAHGKMSTQEVSTKLHQTTPDYNNQSVLNDFFQSVTRRRLRQLS